MERILLTIEYRGTAYAGWQRQPKRPSVQQSIEDALCRLTGVEIKIFGSGRTDAGVHAYGQTAHFDYDGKISPNRFQTALNHFLPRDISITSVQSVTKDFHARFSAKEKTYVYKLYLGIPRSGIMWDTHYVLNYGLNLEKMRSAAKRLIGTHDFSSFCLKSKEPKSTIRELKSIKITPQIEYIDNGELTIEFTANAFLHNMVRILTAQLIKVGASKLDESELESIMKRCDRAYAKGLAPPEGLYLRNVVY